MSYFPRNSGMGWKNMERTEIWDFDMLAKLGQIVLKKYVCVRCCVLELCTCRLNIHR